MPHSEVREREVLSNSSTHPVPPAGASTAGSAEEHHRSSKPTPPLGVSRKLFGELVEGGSALAADGAGGRESLIGLRQPSSTAQGASTRTKFQTPPDPRRPALDLHLEIAVSSSSDERMRDRRTLVDRSFDRIEPLTLEPLAG